MPGTDSPPRIEDAPARNWVERSAPHRLRPWLELVRADRPIGTWLLLLPCWQGIALAAAYDGWKPGDWWLVIAFATGAIAMRSAGCILNDIVDRDFDRAVRRTRGRPIAAGRIRRRGAALLAVVLCLVGLTVLLTMNRPAVVIGLIAILPAALYPYAKRFTYWPQLILGIAFNWGALLGFAAQTGFLHWSPLLLYAGGICWTLGYDTIYAAMDRDDDRRIGVKSLALRFDGRIPLTVAGFYVLAAVCAGAAGIAANAGALFWVGHLAYLLHLAWQVARLKVDDRARCLRLFRSNRNAGLLLLFAILIGGLGT